MNSKEKKQLRKRRFPEFKGDWEEMKLGEVCEIYQPKTITSKQIKKSGLYKVFGANGHIGYFEEYNHRYSEVVVTCRGATCGKVNFTEPKSWITGNSMVLCPIQNSLTKKFLFYLLKLFNLNVLISGSAQPQIIKASFFSKKIPLPPIQEQQKIAACLSSLDEVIRATEEKITLLQNHKKGLLQQLFPAEKQQLPKLRFPEFKGDWEEMKLGKLGKTYGGLTGKTKVDFGFGSSYIQYMQIFSNSNISIKDCGLVQIKDGEKQNMVQYGDVFFTTSSETPKEIGISSVLLDEVENMYLNSFCFGYRPDLHLLEPKYLQFAFREPGFRKMVIRLAQGSTRFNISKCGFMKLSFCFPSIQEQKKIAACLSSLDEVIRATEKKITLLQDHKKGLLQQLFPHNP